MAATAQRIISRLAKKPRRAHSRPRANTRSITLPTLVHACPRRHERDAPSVPPGAEASGAQADLPASVLVRPREASAFDVHHQVFLHGGVWNHSCFHVPFCQIYSSRCLSYGQTAQKRIASVICYLRVYRVGQADTSAKQHIDGTYLEATGNASC
jgi:hypothetical protein